MGYFSSILHNKTAQAVGAWVGLMTAIFTLLGKLTPEWLGALTWPQAILAGIVAALAVSFLGSMVLVILGFGFRLIRPLPVGASAAAPEGASTETRQAITDLTDQLTGLRETFRVNDEKTRARETTFTGQLQVIAEDRKAIIEDYQRMSGLDAQFSDRCVAIETRADQITKTSSDLEQRFNDWTRQHCDSQERRFSWVDGGFKAIYDRELLNTEAGAIELEAAWLLRTSDGEKVDNWGVWSSRHVDWLSKIDKWAEIAGRYIDGCHARIYSVPHQSLQGEWPEPRDMLPSDDAMLAHRAAAVTLRNFKVERDTVERTVISWAYQSPSMKGRQADVPLPGGGSDEQA